MPSRFDTDRLPFPEPGESGESYEYRDSHRPGLYLPNWHSKRDGGDMRVFESEPLQGDKYLLLDRKTRNDGPANGAWQRQIEDHIGAKTGDNDAAVREGERARLGEEMGVNTLPDAFKLIQHEAFVTGKPSHFIYHTKHDTWEGLWADYDYDREWLTVTKVAGTDPNNMEPVGTWQFPVADVPGAVSGHVRPEHNVDLDD